MDIKQLNYFKSIVEQGGISAAARVLQLAQPVLSRALQSLESELGCTLLLRNKSGIELTREGAIFYQKSKVLIADFDAVRTNPFGLIQEKNTSIQYGRTAYWTSWPLTSFHDCIEDLNDMYIESSIILSNEKGLDYLLDGEIDVLLSHDRKWSNKGASLFFQRQMQWGMYLNDKDQKSVLESEFEKMEWLVWATRDDLLSHQLQVDLPYLKKRFFSSQEDLIHQVKMKIGLILPIGMKLEPSGFSLKKILPYQLNFLAYVKNESVEPRQISALEKGMVARW